jgi:copper chaperone
MHELNITGMTCGHCEKAVKEALQSVPGAERVDVDLASGHAVVEGPADLQTLLRVVEKEGYTATVAR